MLPFDPGTQQELTPAPHVPHTAGQKKAKKHLDQQPWQDDSN